MSDDPSFEQVIENSTVAVGYPSSNANQVLAHKTYRANPTDSEGNGKESVQLSLTRSSPSIEEEFMLTAVNRSGVRFQYYRYGITTEGELTKPIGGSPEYQEAPAGVREAIEDWRPEWSSTVEQEASGPRTIRQRLRAWMRS